LKGGRWTQLRMRNAQPQAKEFRLYDHVLTSISSADSYSVGSAEGLQS